MKLTFDNYKEYVPKTAHELFKALLIDLGEINQMLKDNGEEYRTLYIDIQTSHNEYSPERTDPCPDFYGTYSLRFERDERECAASEMELVDLDYVLSIIYSFIEFKDNKNNG